MAITFTVLGLPQPQGSARAFTYRRKAEKGGGIGARVDSDNPKLKAWRRDVARSAQQVHRGPALVGAIRIVAAFYLYRPKSLKTEQPHVTRPDVDKLGRAIGDALTGIVYQDDGQVTEFKVTKAYAAAGDPPRAVIVVTPLDQPLFRKDA